MEIFEKEKFNNLKDQAKEYVQTRIDIAVLSAVKGGSMAAGNAALYLMLALFGFFFLLFISIAAGFALSQWLDSRFAGFLIVGGFYLILSVIFFMFKSKLVVGPVSNAIVNALLNKEEQKNEKH